MSTSTKRNEKKELPIYDPEGMDPQTHPTYEEITIPLQEHVTTTRRAVQHTVSSVKEAWTDLTQDNRKKLISLTGKTRKETNAALSTLGIEDTTQVARGSAYAAAALTGLYFARRRSMFAKITFPLLGAGLVGGVLHRHYLYKEYGRKVGEGNRLSWKPQDLWKSRGGENWWKSKEERGSK